MSAEQREGFVPLATARSEGEANAWREALQKHGSEFHASVPDPIASIALGIRSYQFYVREGDLAVAEEALRSPRGADNAARA